MTQDDFTKAHLANAADDVLQLAFSDWLEQHGDALRAELIRSQVELAEVPREDPRYSKLEKKERALWLKWIRSTISAPSVPHEQV